MESLGSVRFWVYGLRFRVGAESFFLQGEVSDTNAPKASNEFR